jgi:hypothetical protein
MSGRGSVCPTCGRQVGASRYGYYSAFALVGGIVVAAVWMGPGEFAGDVVVPTIERLHHLLAR